MNNSNKPTIELARRLLPESSVTRDRHRAWQYDPRCITYYEGGVLEYPLSPTYKPSTIMGKERGVRGNKLTPMELVSYGFTVRVFSPNNPSDATEFSPDGTTKSCKVLTRAAL